MSTEPRAEALAFTANDLVVHLEEGRTVTIPLEGLTRLRSAAPSMLADHLLNADG